MLFLIFFQLFLRRRSQGFGKHLGQSALMQQLTGIVVDYCCKVLRFVC